MILIFGKYKDLCKQTEQKIVRKKYGFSFFLEIRTISLLFLYYFLTFSLLFPYFFLIILYHYKIVGKIRP